jgi:hypothetical protein
MTFTDELRKALSDPKPLYFVAGAGDAAVSRLREAPIKLAGASDQLNRINDAAAQLMARAPERIAEIQARLDPKAVREAISETDLSGLRERAQTVALGRIGRVLEVAGHAVETYEELAERGKVVVERFRGGVSEDEASSERPFAEHVTVVRVEQVTDDEEMDTVTDRVASTTAERPHATRRATSGPRTAAGSATRRATSGRPRAAGGGRRSTAGATRADKPGADKPTGDDAGEDRTTSRRKPGTGEEPTA